MSRTQLATAAIAVLFAAAACGGGHKPEAVDATAAGSLPPTVSAAFSDLIRNHADGKGMIPVSYVQSTLGAAQATLPYGQVLGVDQATPVWVILARGSFTFRGATNGVQLLPGNAIAVIDASGRVYTGGSIGTGPPPDLGQLGSTRTATVDATAGPDPTSPQLVPTQG